MPFSNRGTPFPELVEGPTSNLPHRTSSTEDTRSLSLSRGLPAP